MERFAEGHAYTYHRRCENWAIAKDSYILGFKKALELAAKIVENFGSKTEILALSAGDSESQGCPLCFGSTTFTEQRTRDVMERFNEGQLCDCIETQKKEGILFDWKHDQHCKGIDRARELMDLPPPQSER